MNDKNHQTATVNEGCLAAAQLNQVPGFDPLKFLNRTGSGKQGEELSLDLRYKKLWFRLAYPKGRMKLIARHITEQMAIFEAQIYLDRSDNEPVGNFTATCTYEQAEDFVKTAQDTALDYALINAGFGVQFGNPATRSEASQPQAKVTRTPAPPSTQQSVVINEQRPGVGKEEVKGNGTKGNIETGAIPPLLKIIPKPAPAVSGGAAAEPKPAGALSGAAGTEQPAPARNVIVKTEEPTSAHNAAVETAVAGAVRNEAVRAQKPASDLSQIVQMAEAMAVRTEPVSQSGLAPVCKETVNREEPAAIPYAAAMSQETTAAVTSGTLPVTEEMDLDRLPVEPIRTVPDLTGEALPAGSFMETKGTENPAAQTKTVPLSRFPQPAMAAAQATPERANVAQEIKSEKELPAASIQPAMAAETQPATAADTQPATAAETQPSAAAETPQAMYTADMPVEEIMQRMTFEEAQNVKVDVGTCNGWTMAQVAERRPPSLKWYVYGYKEDNNILRAAAQIMLDFISREKAG